MAASAHPQFKVLRDHRKTDGSVYLKGDLVYGDTTSIKHGTMFVTRDGLVWHAIPERDLRAINPAAESPARAPISTNSGSSLTQDLQTYTCSQCREAFESVSALSSHTLSAHSSHAAAARGMASTRPSGGSRAATSTPSQATAKISCPMCPFEAYTEAVVSMHVNSAHFDSPANSFNAANEGDAEAPSGVFAASDDRTQPTAPLAVQATRAGFAPAAAAELHPERTASAVGTFSADRYVSPSGTTRSVADMQATGRRGRRTTSIASHRYSVLDSSSGSGLGSSGMFTSSGRFTSSGLGGSSAAGGLARGVVAYDVTCDFEADNVLEMSVSAGQVVYAIGKEREGWLRCYTEPRCYGCDSGNVPNFCIQEQGGGGGDDDGALDGQVLVCHLCGTLCDSFPELESHFQDEHPEELVEDGMANLTLDANAEARHPQFGHINFMNRDTSLTDLPPLLVIDRDDMRVGGAVGPVRGIQGYNNSCYIDTLLVSMFLFNSCFDGLLTVTPDHPDDVEFQRMLREDVVGPLRRHLFVPRDIMSQWRLQLNAFMPGNNPEVPCMEQDIFDLFEVLHKEISPNVSYLSLVRDGVEEDARFYNIMLPPQLETARKAQTVSDLLAVCHAEGALGFHRCPEMLMLQMPRDMANKSIEFVIPDARLDVTAFAGEESNASSGWSDLELFAIVCVESSHYVSFVKAPVAGGEPEWLYFNSMADHDDVFGSIPELNRCPDLAGALATPQRTKDELLVDIQAHEVGQRYKSHKQPYRFTKDTALSADVKRVLLDVYVCLYRPQVTFA